MAGRKLEASSLEKERSKGVGDDPDSWDWEIGRGEFEARCCIS